jgi:hypothetical protein
MQVQEVRKARIRLTTRMLFNHTQSSIRWDVGCNAIVWDQAVEESNRSIGSLLPMSVFETRTLVNV